MKRAFSLTYRIQWLNVPAVALIALLQRTPVVRLLTAGENFVMASPIGHVLRSAVALVATAGVHHSLAGATELAPSVPAPANGTVGTALTISFGITGTLSAPETWTVGGTVPPGTSYNGGITTGTVENSTVTLSGTPTSAGTFDLSLRAHDGPTNTSSATFTFRVVIAAGTNSTPTITTQPLSQTVTVGTNVTFSVVATGSPAPTLQWRKDGANIAGETGTSLALNNVQTTAAGTYTVVATNTAGSVTSNNAVLTVNAASGNAPAVPAGVGGYASAATEVTLTWLPPATGDAPTAYKVERATNTGFTAGLTTINLNSNSTSHIDTTVSNNTTYFYRVSSVNAGGTSVPTAGVQVVTPAAINGGATRFVNIATRASCGVGNNVTIGGFVVAGGVPKQVLVRAVGPSLTAQGIGQAEVLMDPTIEVHKGAPIIAQNDNWGANDNATAITTTAARIGASPLLASDTNSAALLLTLEPGVYSFVASGKGGTSGIVLLEVYDADAAPGGSTFANIATRAFSTTGNGVTIGGFVVAGGAPKQVLLRAVGPTLATLGIGQAEVLADPTIELHQGAPVIAINDDWGQNANAAAIVTTGARIGASPIAGSDARTSALLLKLPPGVYSFIARGKSSASGIVLVEVYDAD